MKVKLLNDGGYSFGEEFVGQILPGTILREYGDLLVNVEFPREVGNGSSIRVWAYPLDEVEIVEE